MVIYQYSFCSLGQGKILQNVVLNINEIISRLKGVLNIQNDAELANQWGVAPKKLAVWKVRNTIPYETLISFCREKGFDLEWALTGENKSDSSRKVNSPTEGLSEEHLSLINTYDAAEEPIKEAALIILKNSSEKPKNTDRKDSSCPKLKSG